MQFHYIGVYGWCPWRRVFYGLCARGLEAADLEGAGMDSGPKDSAGDLDMDRRAEGEESSITDVSIKIW